MNENPHNSNSLYIQPISVGLSL